MSSLLLGVGSCGNLVRNFRPRRSSAGARPVVGCGIPMCSCRIFLSSTLGLLHSTIPVCQAFLKIFMSPSAKSFTSGPLDCVQVGDRCLLFQTFLKKTAVDKWTFIKLPSKVVKYRTAKI